MQGSSNKVSLFKIMWEIRRVYLIINGKQIDGINKFVLTKAPSKNEALRGGDSYWHVSTLVYGMMDVIWKGFEYYL